MNDFIDPFCFSADQDQAEAYETFVRVNGGSPSAFFFECGIYAFSQNNSGWCWFQMDQELMFYQSTNEPLFADIDLAPTLAPNKHMFGRFMGTLELTDPSRFQKRVSFERIAGSRRHIERTLTANCQLIRELLAGLHAASNDIDDFSLNVVLEVVSKIDGVLDLNQYSLRDAWRDGEYNSVFIGFFENASQSFDSEKHDDFAARKQLVSFVKTIIEKNLPSLSSLSSPNLITQTIRHANMDLSQVRHFDDELCCELATHIIATFDTTVLTLVWFLSYLSTSESLRVEVENIARRDLKRTGIIDELEYYVLETVRLAGCNPTALWRRTVRDVELKLPEGAIKVPAGTKVWLDRFASNRCPASFPDPKSYNVKNVKELKNLPRQKATSIVSKNRYEINSFSMVNTLSSERKCPGRVFVLKVVAHIIFHLFNSHDVELDEGNVELAKWSSMPRPVCPGKIQFRSVGASRVPQA